MCMRYSAKRNVIRRAALSLFFIISGSEELHSQTIQLDDTSSFSYSIIESKDFSFSELLAQGLDTEDKKLKVFNAPINDFRSLISFFIRMHNFEMCGLCFSKEKMFRMVKYVYKTKSYDGSDIVLSGMAVFPCKGGNDLKRMMVYCDYVAAGEGFAPSESLPVQTVIAADNTLCVFPDYYGFGFTRDKAHPYMNLICQGRQAVDCAVSAYEIAKTNVSIDTNFYTWIT